MIIPTQLSTVGELKAYIDEWCEDDWRLRVRFTRLNQEWYKRPDADVTAACTSVRTLLLLPDDTLSEADEKKLRDALKEKDDEPDI